MTPVVLAKSQQCTYAAEECYAVWQTPFTQKLSTHSNKWLDPTGQHAATQKKQEPESGNEPTEGDIRKAKTYTTASAAWNQHTPRAMRSNSPALAKGPWGQSRSISTGSLLAAYQRPGERSDTGSDQGSMSEGHSDPNTGSTPFPDCLQEPVVKAVLGLECLYCHSMSANTDHTYEALHTGLDGLPVRHPIFSCLQHHVSTCIQPTCTCKCNCPDCILSKAVDHLCSFIGKRCTTDALCCVSFRQAGHILLLSLTCFQ